MKKLKLLTILVCSLVLLGTISLVNSDLSEAAEDGSVLDASDETVKPTPAAEQDANLDTPEDFENDQPVEDPYNAEGKIENPFKVSLKIGTQSAWNKKVPVFVTITPLINSSRTEIEWDSGFGISFEPKYKNYFPLARGETATYKALINPRESGTYTITASVTDWGYGRNYSSSDSIRITFDQDLITNPKTDGYTLGLALKYLIIVVLLILFGVASFFVGRIVLAWLKEWLKPFEY